VAVDAAHAPHRCHLTSLASLPLTDSFDVRHQHLSSSLSIAVYFELRRDAGLDGVVRHFALRKRLAVTWRWRAAVNSATTMDVASRLRDTTRTSTPRKTFLLRGIPTKQMLGLLHYFHHAV